MNNLNSARPPVSTLIRSIPDKAVHQPLEPQTDTPIADGLELDGIELNKISNFKSVFDYNAYRKIERRFANNPMRGGFVMRTAFRLANSHSTCQQCLYSFEIDTYGRGCLHECTYCYAKAELTVHGMWNNPIPVPININDVRRAFYLTFETEKRHRFREILLRRIPLRIGSMSDSFMRSDKMYKVTQELLKILKFYNYPYIVFTRSDLVADDDYLKLFDPGLAAIQFSMSSVDDGLTKIIEPGAPSPSRRLKALKLLASEGLWTTVRINPLFPSHPDGFFTDPSFSYNGAIPSLNISNLDMVDKIAEHNVPAILVGFGRFSGFALNSLSRALNVDMRSFFKKNESGKSSRDYHFSEKEIQFYYRQFQQRAIKNCLEFTTCYIGNGESHFWNDQDKWTNKSDCCNAKGHVAAFGRDSREIPFDTRLKFTSRKDSTPLSSRLHDQLGMSPVTTNTIDPL